MRYALIALSLIASPAHAGWCIEQCGLTRVPTEPSPPTSSRTVCVQRYVNGNLVTVCTSEDY